MGDELAGPVSLASVRMVREPHHERRGLSLATNWQGRCHLRPFEWFESLTTNGGGYRWRRTGRAGVICEPSEWFESLTTNGRGPRFFSSSTRGPQLGHRIGPVHCDDRTRYVVRGSAGQEYSCALEVVGIAPSAHGDATHIMSNRSGWFLGMSEVKYVGNQPGYMALDWMLSLAQATARLLESCTRPPLLAE